MYIYPYIYMNINVYIFHCDYYIYVWHTFCAKVFRFHIESWPEWDLNPRPRAYGAHALTTELSGRMIRCA